MRSDKPTDIFCEKKKIPKRGSKFPHLVTKNMRALSERPRETPIGVEKCLLPQSGTVPDFLAKVKINQFQ